MKFEFWEFDKNSRAIGIWLLDEHRCRRIWSTLIGQNMKRHIFEFHAKRNLWNIIWSLLPHCNRDNRLSVNLSCHLGSNKRVGDGNRSVDKNQILSGKLTTGHRDIHRNVEEIPVWVSLAPTPKIYWSTNDFIYSKSVLNLPLEKARPKHVEDTHRQRHRPFG